MHKASTLESKLKTSGRRVALIRGM